MLDSELSHVAMSRSRDARRIRKRQRWTVFDEQFNDAADANLFFLGEALEPARELVGAFDLPRHRHNMPSKALCVKRYTAAPTKAATGALGPIMVVA